MPENLPCTLSVDPAIPCVVMHWHRYATTPQFREACRQLKELRAQEGLDRVLIDLASLPLLAGEDQEWLHRHWLPGEIASGLRGAALVSSRFYFARVGVENVNRRLEPDQIAVRTFAHPEEAREWLRGLGAALVPDDWPSGQ